MKRNKGIKIGIISLIMLLLVPSQIVFAATAPFGFQKEKIRVKGEEPFTLKLNGKSVSDLYGFEVALAFDESQIEMVSKPTVDFAPGFLAGPTKDADGNVYIGFTKMGQTDGENGKLTLGDFYFKVKKPGVHKLQLVSVKVIDSKGSSQYTKVGQSIEVKVVGKGKGGAHQDVSGHWAETCIQAIVDEGYMNGKSDQVFGPNDMLTRAEMATLLVNVTADYNSTEVTHTPVSTPLFRDVKGDEWYAQNILKMTQRGFIKGYEDATYKPKQWVTRSEVISVIARLGREHGTYTAPTSVEETLAVYQDAKEVPVWAREDLAWAVENGLIKGDAQANLRSQGQISRAEMAVILCRKLQLEDHE
ncbi:MAG: S-layer homology domain-containing protein [Cellulosilyticaceae bacterium]